MYLRYLSIFPFFLSEFLSFLLFLALALVFWLLFVQVWHSVTVSGAFCVTCLVFLAFRLHWHVSSYGVFKLTFFFLGVTLNRFSKSHRFRQWGWPISISLHWKANQYVCAERIVFVNTMDIVAYTQARKGHSREFVCKRISSTKSWFIFGI